MIDEVKSTLALIKAKTDTITADLLHLNTAQDLMLIFQVDRLMQDLLLMQVG